MNKVQFRTNVPEEVTLLYPQGKPVDGQFGPQVLFTLEGERVMYVPPIVQDRITQLGLGRGERVQICKQEMKQGNRKSIQWDVRRVDAPPGAAPAPAGNGYQTASTHNTNIPQSHTNGNAYTNGHSPRPAAESAPPIKPTYGEAMYKALMLAGTATRKAEIALGTQHGGAVRFDSRDVAALATTLLIQWAREGYLQWED